MALGVATDYHYYTAER